MICTHYDHSFATDMQSKFVDYNVSLSSGSATSEPSPLGTNKSTRTSATGSSAAAPNAPVLLQDRPLPRHRDPFEEESEEEDSQNEAQDSDFELDTSLPKVSSDRELRPRASRVISFKLRG
jgi:hypothetical protein